MGGLSFLQKWTGRTSSEQLKKTAIKEAEEIIKLKQQNEDLRAQVAQGASDMNRVNAELQQAVSKVCPPPPPCPACPPPPACPTLDLNKVKLKDIPNVGDKFKMWLKTLPATTEDRKKIVD
jgi:cell division septum initiation protein DivIVA